MSEPTRTQPGARFARRRRDHKPLMRREMAGLHAGAEVRTERFEDGWRAEARMRDVASTSGSDMSSGLFEYHPDGQWTQIGTYRTLRLAEVAFGLLKEGTYLVRSTHFETCGDVDRKVPAALIRWDDARRLMVDLGLAEDVGTSQVAP